MLLANRWGIPSSLVEDPASQSNVSISGGGWLKGAVVAAASLLAGGVAVAGLIKWLHPAAIEKVIDQTKDLNVTGKVLYEPPQ